MLMNKPQPIRARACPRCLLCGSEGRLVHLELHDRLFGAYGTWNLKKCARSECGLIWLDPMPLTEDIAKAYANYYTHAPPRPPTTEPTAGALRRSYRLMKNGYLAGKYGYELGPMTLASRAAGRLMWLVPHRRARLDSEVRRLHAVPGGRLLDIGCGTGEWLLWMRRLGWQVEGLDFDERAVKVANQLGLSVRLGSLEQQQFPDGTFDAVTMSHVIEHVPDPVHTLRECARILSPGGKLFLWTPNARSLGHRTFGRNWRGLEPPRHLHIFSPRSVRALLSKADFANTSVCTRNSTSILAASMALVSGNPKKERSLAFITATKVVTAVLALAEWGALLIDSRVGELLEVQAAKSSRRE